MQVARVPTFTTEPLATRYAVTLEALARGGAGGNAPLVCLCHLALVHDHGLQALYNANLGRLEAGRGSWYQDTPTGPRRAARTSVQVGARAFVEAVKARPTLYLAAQAGDVVGYGRGLTTDDPDTGAPALLGPVALDVGAELARIAERILPVLEAMPPRRRPWGVPPGVVRAAQRVAAHPTTRKALDAAQEGAQEALVAAVGRAAKVVVQWLTGG